MVATVGAMVALGILLEGEDGAVVASTVHTDEQRQAYRTRAAEQRSNNDADKREITHGS